MKITANWVLQHFPFLAGLLEQGGVAGRKRLRLRVNLTPVTIHGLNDGETRYTSVGQLSGQCFTHYAGCGESAINDPIEQVGNECPFEGKVVSPGCFYAVLDLHEYYGVRDLTVYFNIEDLRQASTELRNQLTPLLPFKPGTTDLVLDQAQAGGVA